MAKTAADMVAVPRPRFTGHLVDNVIMPDRAGPGASGSEAASWEAI